MKAMIPYKKIEDSRGKFLGIVNSGDWEEINYIETMPGEVRGGHYHKETRELFYIIEGEIDIEIKHLHKSVENNFTVTSGSIFIIEPFEIHTFICKTKCMWINVLSKKIDDQFCDIHRVL
ncbi:MAG: cupin domain-containing protein [Nitrospiraceae bacterium]|nr:cupin domain-containing protein [Nitrospiraceae bacterium]